MDCRIDLNFLSKCSQEAIEHLINVLFNDIWPVIIRIRNKLCSYDGKFTQDEIKKVQDVFSLCCSQIRKGFLVLLEIFKFENCRDVFLHETRQCAIERLAWCINKLYSIEEKLDLLYQSDNGNNENKLEDVSMFANPMYFVNWIDHTFEVLNKLSNIIYQSNIKNDEKVLNEWKYELVDCIQDLQVTLDELLLSAMTLCKYCLLTDQHVVKARCQVVLREAKNLFNELVEDGVNLSLNVTMGSLKLPLKPSNVNILIDVLKDVLYVLETNTNTALLSLVIHCFCNNNSPVFELKNHLKNIGDCHCKSEITDDCNFVKQFDLYNERLMQIGSFAISCSSDLNRILSVRSGLASLEALDAHLVPALLMSPDSTHATLLTNSWLQEVKEIRDSVFLIVDPAAFADKSKQIIQQMLLEIIKNCSYDNSAVCLLINTGNVLLEFFGVYKKYEPDVLTHYDKLIPLLDDLNKVQKECKIVSDMLCSSEEFTYGVKNPKSHKPVTFNQLLKRLKLMYTLVNRISNILSPKSDDQFFIGEEDELPILNVTHTINIKGQTYVESPKKDITRSIFARTTNIRANTPKFPLNKLLKSIRAKREPEMNFSVQLDQLLNLSDDQDQTKPIFVNKTLLKTKETSILYNFSPTKNRSSLRKAVLRRHCNVNLEKINGDSVNIAHDSASLMDETTSLQIAEILDQMNEISNTFTTKLSPTRTFLSTTLQNINTSNNVLQIDINNSNKITTRNVWNFPVNTSAVEVALHDNSATPSNINTLERISDLDFVERKLNTLKANHEETSL